MIKEIKAPGPGESVSEIEIATWLVNDGDLVVKDQEIAEIESEKATLPLIAEEAGRIKILIPSGERIPVGTVVCTIEVLKVTRQERKDKTRNHPETTEKSNEILDVTVNESVEEIKKNQPEGTDEFSQVKVTPVAKQMMKDFDLSVEDIIRGLRKINSEDVKKVIQQPGTEHSIIGSNREISRDESRRRMSLLRKKLSERLVSVKNETAMLTTFNEADMSRIISVRKQYQEEFLKKHGVKLGYMSFFIKASSLALKLFPLVNSRIEGDEIITPEYCDIGIAVQTEKGLMVPVIRNAGSKDFAGIEKEISVFAQKAGNNRLSIDEMKGGTFTITNGGIFGSLMSTPILNPPQAAILGMHKIVERPVAVIGQVVIRPMMYLALSYDHRIIDGKDSVAFLVKIRELVENPESLLFDGNDPGKILLNL